MTLKKFKKHEHNKMKLFQQFKKRKNGKRSKQIPVYFFHDIHHEIGKRTIESVPDNLDYSKIKIKIKN